MHNASQRPRFLKVNLVRATPMRWLQPPWNTSGWSRKRSASIWRYRAESRGSASATGVFMTILDTNRQLNLLLDVPILPRDVFDQVTLAVLYSAAILSHHGVEDYVPDAVPFDTFKRPADVYRLLLNSADLLSNMAEKSGVSVLRLSSRRNIPDDIEPGHVYDLARILVAGLAVLSDTLDAQDVFPGAGAAGADLPDTGLRPRHGAAAAARAGRRAALGPHIELLSVRQP